MDAEPYLDDSEKFVNSSGGETCDFSFACIRGAVK